jgi:hypothetical protein
MKRRTWSLVEEKAWWPELESSPCSRRYTSIIADYWTFGTEFWARLTLKSPNTMAVHFNAQAGPSKPRSTKSANKGKVLDKKPKKKAELQELEKLTMEFVSIFHLAKSCLIPTCNRIHLRASQSSLSFLYPRKQRKVLRRRSSSK